MEAFCGVEMETYYDNQQLQENNFSENVWKSQAGYPTIINLRGIIGEIK